VPALDRERAALGSKPGNPPGLTMATVRAEVRIYRAQRCAACRPRGHAVRRYRRGTDQRLVLTRSACGH
jgi:hypothetical protein